MVTFWKFASQSQAIPNPQVDALGMNAADKSTYGRKLSIGGLKDGQGWALPPHLLVPMAVDQKSPVKHSVYMAHLLALAPPERLPVDGHVSNPVALGKRVC